MRKDIAAIAALVFLCVVAWRGLFGHYFWEDDFLCIYLGKHMSLGALFGTSPNFRPLDRASFFLNYELSGLDPLGYNLVNVGLHAANAILIYLLGRALFGGRLAGFAAAAFFATANLHSDAVFWISARPGLLSLLFLLVSMNLWTLFRKSGKPVPWYYLVILSLSLAFLSKEEAVVYPLLVILTDRLLLGDTGKGERKWAWYSGMLAVLAVYLVFQAYTQLNPATQSVNISQEIYVLGANIPINLLEIFLYLFSPSFVDIQALTLGARLASSAVVVAALLFAGYLAGYKRESAWAAAWVIIAFLPMSLFRWELVTAVETSFIRRYFYTPSVGVAFAFGLFAAWLYSACRSGKAAAGLVSVILAASVCWNIYMLGEREKVWRMRTEYVRGEVNALKRLYPSLPISGAGVYLDGFVQRNVFQQPMLRLIYANDKLVLYDDSRGLLGDSNAVSKVVIYKKGDIVRTYPSCREVSITGPSPVQGGWTE